MVFCAKRLLQYAALLWVALCIFSSSYGLDVMGLYTASVPIKSQQASLRAKAYEQALEQVLIKATGNLQVVGNPIIKQQLPKASNYVQQYGYQTVEDKTTMPPMPTLMLQVQFEPDAVQSLLDQAGVALWGNNRPLVVMWLALQDDSQPTIVSNSDEGPVPELFKKLAEQRGIPLMLPMMDLTDINSVTMNDIIDDQAMPVMQASQRYGSDAILMGSLQQQGPQQWIGQWHLISQGQEFSWTTQGKDDVSVVTQAMDNLTNNLSTRYAVMQGTGQQSQTNITVSNVSGLKQFAEVQAYLKKLAPVTSVNVMQMDPDAVTFSLDYEGTLDTLTQAVALDHKLLPTQAAVDNNVGLSYQWVY